jgi:hypothetical protein
MPGWMIKGVSVIGNMIGGVSVIGIIKGGGVSLAKNGIWVTGTFGVPKSTGAHEETNKKAMKVAANRFMVRVSSRIQKRLSPYCNGRQPPLSQARMIRVTVASKTRL